MPATLFPSPRKRGEGGEDRRSEPGEGGGEKTEGLGGVGGSRRSRDAPHPAPSAPTSPRKRGEVFGAGRQAYGGALSFVRCRSRLSVGEPRSADTLPRGRRVYPTRTLYRRRVAQR